MLHKMSPGLPFLISRSLSALQLYSSSALFHTHTHTLYPLFISAFSYLYNTMTESVVDYYDTLDVHVRWADGTDLVITISPTQDTVGTLKQKVPATMTIPKQLQSHTMTIRSGSQCLNEPVKSIFGLSIQDVSLTMTRRR